MCKAKRGPSIIDRYEVPSVKSLTINLSSKYLLNSDFESSTHPIKKKKRKLIIRLLSVDINDSDGDDCKILED